MNRLVLIDGTNFFFRGSWAGNLTVDGLCVKYIYTFFRSLVGTIKQFERDGYRCDFVVCWDGGYSERLRVSQAAVDRGLISKSYKQERRDAREYQSDEEQDDKENFVRQLVISRALLEHTRIHQCFIDGEEADDLVGSYVEKYHGKYDDVILISSDKDYYQLLRSNVRIWNSYKKDFIDESFLKSEFGLDSASQWIDVGALAGESGAGSDTIYGVPGIGIKTGCKLIAEHGSLEKLLAFAKKHFSAQLAEHGGVEGMQAAIDAGNLKLKSHKKEFKVLAYEDVVKLAYELKRIRTWLDVSIDDKDTDWRMLENAFRSMQFRFSENDFGLLLQ